MMKTEMCPETREKVSGGNIESSEQPKPACKSTDRIGVHRGDAAGAQHRHRATKGAICLRWHSTLGVVQTQS